MRSVAGDVIRGSLGNLIEWYDWYASATESFDETVDLVVSDNGSGRRTKTWRGRPLGSGGVRTTALGPG